MNGGAKTAVDHDLESHIGRAIKRVRKARKLTQSDVSDALAISFQQYQKIENGKNRISASRLLELSLLYDLPIEVFLEDAKTHLLGVRQVPGQPAARKESAIRLNPIINEIADAAFRNAVTQLIKQHNEVVAKNST